jgi:hypothetical protein
MQGESTAVPQAPRRPGRSLAVLALLASVLAARPGRAEEGRKVTASLEVSAGRDYRAWSLLGDVALHEDTTFLTLGYTAARPESGTAATHQLSLGMDHVLGEHWLVAATASVGLPKSTLTALSPERPRLNLPSVDARTGYSSQALLLSAAYDSAGFSNVEYGLDAGLSVTRYPLSREIVVPTRNGTLRYAREDLLWVARPSVGGRLMLGTRWEVGLRAGLTLYSEDPLTAGQFTDAETEELTRRFENALEARRALLGLSTRINRDLGSGVAQRVSDLNATTGIPTAPSLFDLKPSVTWRPSRAVRGQLSYAFTRYVSGEGLSHVLATRWTVRLGETARVWASVALQQDRLEAVEGGDASAAPSRTRSGLFTVGGEYTF